MHRWFFCVDMALTPNFVSVSSPAFVMFWLVALLFLFDPVGAVCVHCLGNVPGCGGSDSCPLMTGVTDNAAALAASASTLVVVAKLLPNKILRVLPRSVLDTIKSMVNKPTAAASAFHVPTRSRNALASNKF